MKKILSLIIIGILSLSSFSTLVGQVETQEHSEPETLASGLDEPEGLLVHDGFVYWVERQHYLGQKGRMGKVPIDGEPADATPFADIREPTRMHDLNKNIFVLYVLFSLTIKTRQSLCCQSQDLCFSLHAE